jgi:hypothetical protein
VYELDNPYGSISTQTHHAKITNVLDKKRIIMGVPQEKMQDNQSTYIGFNKSVI